MTTQIAAPGTFCWNELGTRDAAGAKQFYADVFGYQTEDRTMPGGMGTYTMLKVGTDDVAGLYNMDGPMFEGVPPHWMSYVCVTDVDATVAKAQELGGTAMGEPMDVPEVGRMAWIQDPTGATVALFKPGKHCGAPQLGTAHGAFCWNELITSDVEKCKAFFTGLFGWTAETDQGSMPYTVFKQGETMVAGLMAKPPEMGEAPPCWMSYIHVDDCDATTAKAQEHGAQVYAPPMSIPNVGRFAVLGDPTGAAVAIITLGA